MPTSARWEVANSPKIPVKYGASCRVDVGIDPYEACTHGVRSFELLHISREKSRKTEAVFLVGSRRPGGKSKSLRARFLLPAFSFGEAKENAEGQLQISNTGSYIVMCIIDHKNSTDSPKDFQLSPLPAATPQALRAGSP